MTGPLLACLPPAGAGASMFREWAHDRIEIVPLLLAGRETRFAQPPILDMQALVADLLPQLSEAAEHDGELVLFGHSFGAIVAYELARALARDGRAATLVASGSAGPGTHLHAPISALPDAEFIEGVRVLTSYVHPAMDDPELLELILPALRADMQLHESYSPQPGSRLPGPVLVVRGRDDQLVSATALEQWRDLASGRFAIAELPGGHMYLTTATEELLELIAAFSSSNKASHD